MRAVSFPCVYRCAACACDVSLVPVEAGSGLWSLWNWSFRQLARRCHVGAGSPGLLTTDTSLQPPRLATLLLFMRFLCQVPSLLDRGSPVLSEAFPQIRHGNNSQLLNKTSKKFYLDFAPKTISSLSPHATRMWGEKAK